jgi:hypothetical protein
MTAGTYCDPWGTPYFIKLNTDYNNVMDYYGDNPVSVIVASFGPTKTQNEPGRSGFDNIGNF